MKQKDILLLLIPVTLIVVAWIVFNIYHNSVTSTISGTLNTNILPISPNFDTKTISNLKERERIVPVFQLQKAETLTPTLSPTPTPTLIPSPSISEPSATNAASINP
jgi:hypothetical protein